MNVDRSSTTMQMDAKYKAVKQSRCMTRVITALRFPINKTVSSTTDREYCRMSAYPDVLAQRAQSTCRKRQAWAEKERQRGELPRDANEECVHEGRCRMLYPKSDWIRGRGQQ